MATATAAATRAQRQELPRITGEGSRSLVEGGAPHRAFWVASRSEPGREHVVYVMRGRLWCDCPGSRYRGTCTHRAIVRKALEAEALKVRQAEAAAEAEADRGWTLTPRGKAALDEWRASQARETAPRRMQTFSLLK
jgi:hypothetical protein